MRTAAGTRGYRYDRTPAGWQVFGKPKTEGSPGGEATIKSERYSEWTETKKVQDG